MEYDQLVWAYKTAVKSSGVRRADPVIVRTFGSNADLEAVIEFIIGSCERQFMLVISAYAITSPKTYDLGVGTSPVSKSKAKSSTATQL